MKDAMLTTICLLILILALGIIVEDVLLRRDCVASGGHYVRGLYDLECVK